jgi:hypothetical protein
MEALEVTINGKKIGLDEPISKTDARALRKEVSRRAARKTQDDLELCRWLYQTRHALVKDGDENLRFFEYCEYEDWQSYVEQEVGMIGPVAEQYARVWAKFAVELGDHFDPSLAVNIRKMIHLANQPYGAINEKNVNKLLKRAATLGIDDLAALVDPQGEWQRSRKHVTYHFRRQEDRHRRNAFKLLREEFGEDMTEGGLFVELCKFYIQAKNLKKKKGATNGKPKASTVAAQLPN